MTRENEIHATLPARPVCAVCGGDFTWTEFPDDDDTSLWVGRCPCGVEWEKSEMPTWDTIAKQDANVRVLLASVRAATAEIEELRATLANERAKCRAADRVLAEIATWVVTFGRSLIPTGPDTYGEGMRGAKSAVATILKANLRADSTIYAFAADCAVEGNIKLPGNSATPTIFECRCCTRTVCGYNDGTVQAPGWRTLVHIDGPNAICPRCVADPSQLDGHRDEYPNVAIGPAMPVKE